MKKKPSRQTPEERAVQRECFDDLEKRIRGLTNELETVGSAYTLVGLDDQLAYSIARIDAELRSTS